MISLAAITPNPSTITPMPPPPVVPPPPRPDPEPPGIQDPPGPARPPAPVHEPGNAPPPQMQMQVQVQTCARRNGKTHCSMRCPILCPTGRPASASFPA